MREISFRGKTEKGEWVQSGSIIHFNDEGTEKLFYIPKSNEKSVCVHDADDNIISVEKGTFYKVIPETIGQYTGLTDKNDTKIFEGDIVEGHCHSQWNHRLQRCAIVYDRDSFKSRHYLNYPNEEHYFEYKVLFSKDVVVIGNIHDNPELLKSE